MYRPLPLSITFCVILAASATALAQPGHSGFSGPDHHATPPPPTGLLPAPMTSLPPPTNLAPGELPDTPFPNSDRSFAVVTSGFIAYVERDGSIRFSDNSRIGGLTTDPVFGPSITFDITELVMDWLGEDPYLAEKLSILDQTRPARIRRRTNENQRLMDNALSDLPIYLQAVWSYPEWSHSTRRQLLFELWDEAAEDGNDHIREGGQRARVIISHFIATRLPAESELAFTRAEIERFNRKRSSEAAFAPYRAATADQLAASEAPLPGGGLSLAVRLMARRF